MASDPPSNSLGLDLENLKISAPSDTPPPLSIPKHSDHATDDTSDAPVPISPDAEDGKGDDSKNGVSREKKKPYVNLERVKTGGAPRDKLTDEELVQRMTRIREQNEKIKQRRVDVQADEDAFKKTQQAERIKQAKARKVQETVDRTREQNAKRKMEKMQSREWDSGKKGGDWTKAQPQKPVSTESIKISSVSSVQTEPATESSSRLPVDNSEQAPLEIDPSSVPPEMDVGATSPRPSEQEGGPSSRGTGRGRGRGGPHSRGRGGSGDRGRGGARGFAEVRKTSSADAAVAPPVKSESTS